MAKVVGIDLGTTNSVVAFMEAGQPTVITNVEGARTTPSVVAYSKNGERLVGQLARRQSVLNPANTIYSAKRFVGRRFDEVDSEREQVSFEIVDGKGGEARIRIPQLNSDVTPEEISAMVLQKLKADAEEYLGEEVKQAVITNPGVLQRQSAPGDQERRHHSRAGCAADHQRTDRRLAGLRAREKVRRDHSGLGPGRRDLRRVGARGRRRRLRSQGHQR